MTKINREIFTLAIPNIVSNISVPLLSSVDSVLMGGLSIRHLAAVGLGSMIFNLMYWSFGFLRMTTTGLTAQSFGAGKKVLGVMILIRGSILAITIALIILASKSLLFDVFSYLFNIGVSDYLLVAEYFHTRIWAAPATLLLYVVMGWFFGNQNARLPMFLTIIINVVNIVLSYYLVQKLELGVKGVALGTVIAQYVGLFIAVIYIYRNSVFPYKSVFYQELFNLDVIKQFFRLNSDVFIRTFCLTVAFSFFFSQSNLYGAVVMGANVILLQFVNWMSYGVDGFAYATESLVGKYVGGGNARALKEVINMSFLWSFLVALAFSIIFYLFGTNIIDLFSDDAIAIEQANALLPFIWLFPVLGFASYVWDGVFIGLMATKEMRDTMFLAVILYFLVIVILPSFEDGRQLWFALISFVVARSVFQTIWYSKKIRHDSLDVSGKMLDRVV